MKPVAQLALALCLLGVGILRSNAQSADEPAAPAAQDFAPSQNSSNSPAKQGTSAGDSQKKVVRNGGTSDPSIKVAPMVSAQQESEQTQNTQRLLSVAEANLKILAGRPQEGGLPTAISEMKNYVEQAKAALDGGDIERAHKIAVKASILTNDMVRHP